MTACMLPDMSSTLVQLTNVFPLPAAPAILVISPYLKPPSSASSIRAHPVLAQHGGWDLIEDSAAARTVWPSCGLAGGASVIFPLNWSKR